MRARVVRRSNRGRAVGYGVRITQGLVYPALDEKVLRRAEGFHEDFLRNGILWSLRSRSEVRVR
jgi:hypothetical protein